MTLILPRFSHSLFLPELVQPHSGSRCFCFGFLTLATLEVQDPLWQFSKHFMSCPVFISELSTPSSSNHARHQSKFTGCILQCSCSLAVPPPFTFVYSFKWHFMSLKMKFGGMSVALIVCMAPCTVYMVYLL